MRSRKCENQFNRTSFREPTWIFTWVENDKFTACCLVGLKKWFAGFSNWSADFLGPDLRSAGCVRSFLSLFDEQRLNFIVISHQGKNTSRHFPFTLTATKWHSGESLVVIALKFNKEVNDCVSILFWESGTDFLLYSQNCTAGNDGAHWNIFIQGCIIYLVRQNLMNVR